MSGASPIHDSTWSRPFFFSFVSPADVGVLLETLGIQPGLELPKTTKHNATLNRVFRTCHSVSHINSLSRVVNIAFLRVVCTFLSTQMCALHYLLCDVDVLRERWGWDNLWKMLLFFGKNVVAWKFLFPVAG